MQVAQGTGALGAHFAVLQLQARLVEGIAGLAQAQVVVARRTALGGQLVDARGGGGHLGAGGGALRLGLLEQLAGNVLAGHQLAEALGLARELLRRGLGGELVGAGGGEAGVELGVVLGGLLQRQLGGVDGEAEGFGVEAEQQLPSLDVGVVGHGDVQHLAADPGRQAQHRARQLGLGGDGHPQVGREEVGEEQHEGHDGAPHPAGEPLVGGHGYLGNAGRIGRATSPQAGRWAVIRENGKQLRAGSIFTGVSWIISALRESALREE
ncbi:hypothetical protein PSm6_18350 [Pseudomonas solani]|uniref:Uncharacterized protein n=1 Tax=Pseudomonas solani TaxID=2731552 RepID=A0ABM7L755_9PSED|nr:hypothetical protein PSm6_18350 [Pseudomonas solani]